MKRRILRHALILAVSAALLMPVGALAAPYFRGGVVGAPAIEGVALRGSSAREASAAVQILATAWLDTPVTLVVDDLVVHRTRRELGGRVDVPATRREILVRGRTGNPLSDVAAHGAVRLDLARRFDERAAASAIQQLRREVDISPLAPQIDAHGRASPAASGRTLSGLAASIALERGVLTSRSVIEIPVQRLSAPAALNQPLSEALYTQVVSEFTTRFAEGEEQWGRRTNIEAAAAAIDGAIVDAQQTISFNALVGERTIGRGFRPADEINDGRVVEGIGGGICQVAATLHAAAFLGGLEIVEHHPHTGTSRYIDLGLDASVSWPSSDLKIRNPFSFPLRVRATSAGGVMTVTLLGSARGPEVRWSTKIEETIARTREVEVVSGRMPGSEEVVQEGVDGAILRRERVILRGGGEVREIAHITYSSMPRIVRVAQ